MDLPKYQAPVRWQISLHHLELIERLLKWTLHDNRLHHMGLCPVNRDSL